MSNGISHLALAAEQTFWVILTHFSFCVDQSCLVKGFFFHKQNICELLRKPLWPFLTLQVGVIDQLFSGKWMLMIKRSTWLSKDKCFLPVALWPLVKDIKGPTMCVCTCFLSFSSPLLAVLLVFLISCRGSCGWRCILQKFPEAVCQCVCDQGPGFLLICNHKGDFCKKKKKNGVKFYELFFLFFPGTKPGSTEAERSWLKFIKVY